MSRGLKRKARTKEQPKAASNSPTTSRAADCRQQLRLKLERRKEKRRQIELQLRSYQIPFAIEDTGKVSFEPSRNVILALLLKVTEYVQLWYCCVIVH